ncbi:AAA family ATPase [bacterium]|nr:AAA family ATPase [bacterium]
MTLENLATIKKMTVKNSEEDISPDDRKAIVDWLKGFPADWKKEMAATLLSGCNDDDPVMPIEIIRQTVSNEFAHVEAYLVDNLDRFTADDKLELHSESNVMLFYKLVKRACLSIIHHYLTARYNRYRTFSFRRTNQPWESYINTVVNFQKCSLFGDYRDNHFSRTIHIDEIEDINWMTEARPLQQLYCLVDNWKKKLDVLVFTLGRLLTVRKLEHHVKGLIEDYADSFNIDGLIKHQKIKKFEKWLIEAEKVGIPAIDNEISKIYGRFIGLLDRKVDMLKERNDHYLKNHRNEPVIEGGPSIHLHEKEVSGGYTYRLIKNDTHVSSIELIPPDQLTDAELADSSAYFKIPYFNAPNQEIEPVPFTLTEWHLSLLAAKMPLLHTNPNTNTLFMGLAGTGKDYFIKWISYLMNVRQCVFDCRQVEEINDLFYTRRIKDGADYFVPTGIYRAIKNIGCLIYLAEVNKLGEKFSDLNALHDFKREVFIPVDGRTYKLPAGNLIVASANPAWFGGGRSKLEPDVKDRYQNIINYDYLPFFSNDKHPKLPKYFSHEAEIRYHMFPQLEKMDQLKVRLLWKKLFRQGYDDSSDQANFDRSKPSVRALLVLKQVLRFVNIYRDAYEKFRKAKSDTIATEMLTQRGVEEIIRRIVGSDRGLNDFHTYKQVIRRYMHERFEDVDESDRTVEQFLKV